MCHDVLSARQDFSARKKLLPAQNVPKENTKMSEDRGHVSHVQKELLLLKVVVSQLANASPCADMEPTAPQDLFHVWNAKEIPLVVFLHLKASRDVQIVQPITSHFNQVHKMLLNAERSVRLEHTPILG